ncbi:MAG: DUF4012 domain-containing protein [Chloroflexota bacterium]|nr:DUF4012 domain-containing protein [Chloroflexota bacterium]
MSTSFTEDTRPIQPVTTDSVVLAPNAPTRDQRNRRRKKRSPKWVRQTRRGLANIRILTVLMIVIAIVAVVVVGTLVVTADAQTKVQAAYSNLTRVLNDVSGKRGNELTLTDFNRLQESINELAGTLWASREQVGFLRSISQANPELQSTMISLDVSVELAHAAKDILNGLQPALFLLFNGESAEIDVAQLSSGERTVELLNLGRGQFANAQQRLIYAQSLLDSIDLDLLSGESLLAVEQLRGYSQQLDQVNNILLQMPELLETAFGLGNSDSNYLILSQNNDEIRPSGGFISTFGWLTVRNARITDYNYRPSGSGEPNPPPESFASQLAVPSWWIRSQQPIYMAWDGSWYADFPSTARMAVWFYNNGNNPRSPVDGVLAIDIDGFLAILNALGDVEVPGYGVTVNTNNFRNVVYDIRAYSIGLEPHKVFVAAVYRAIFERWQQIEDDPELSSRVLGAALGALQEKHLMLYFADERLNEAVRLLGWAGEQQSGIGHDYLMIADANLGNKSNHSVLRQVTYDADIQSDGSVNGRATILYDYPERLAANDPAVNEEYHGQRDYFTMQQVFVPIGSQLNSTSDNSLRAAEVYTTPTHTDFVSLILVPYNLSERYQLNYTTSNVVEPFGTNWRYRLLIQKQPGTRAEPVNVQITLPSGARLIEVSPIPAAQYQLERQLLEFQFELSTDVWIEVVYAMPEANP